MNMLQYIYIKDTERANVFLVFEVQFGNVLKFKLATSWRGRDVSEHTRGQELIRGLR